MQRIAMLLPAVMAAAAQPSFGHITSNQHSQQECFAHVHRCLIPVYVHAIGTKDCSVWIDPAVVIVNKPDTAFINKVKVVWVLKRGDGNTKLSQYSFQKDTGFTYDDTTGAQPRDSFTLDGDHGWDTPDSDDPNSDDDSPAASASRRFRMVSTTKVPANPIHYNLTVIRKNGNACTSTDPTITNSN